MSIFNEKRYIGPEFDWRKMANPVTPGEYLWAPDVLRNIIGGDQSKQAWAGKMTQAGLYGALLASLGYGSRKLLRGTAPETQDALDAIDKYLDSTYDPQKEGEKELVNKADYDTPGKKIREAIRRKLVPKGASDIDNFSYLLPPGAAVMGWLIGQKIAENNIKNGDLRKSKARLAKARSDYNRTLAQKLDPNLDIPEQVPVQHLESPVDWAIDKGIEVKNGALKNIQQFFANAQAKREARLAAKDQKAQAKAAGAAPVEPEVAEAPKMASEDAAAPTPKPIDIRPRELTPNDFRDRMGRKLSEVPSVFGGFLSAVERYSGATPWLMMLGALSFLGAGKYAWNNERALDKNIQTALDKEAAIKHRAAQTNDQRINLGKIMPGSEVLNTSPNGI